MAADAAGQRHAHRADVGVHLLAHLDNLFQVLPALGGRGAALDHEEIARRAPAAHGIGAVLHGYVVVHDDGADLDAFGLRHFAAHIPAHPVALVVVDDVQHAGVVGDQLGALIHVIHGRRREYVAGQAASSMPLPTHMMWAVRGRTLSPA